MPQLITWKQENFKGEVWNFTTQSGTTPNTFTYFYTYWKDATFSAQSDGMGRLTCFFDKSIDDITTSMQIRNLTDRDGTELFGGGLWTVTEYQPVLDIWDRLSGYRAKLSLNVAGSGA
jgi:hypothetical protein